MSARKFVSPQFSSLFPNHEGLVAFAKQILIRVFRMSVAWSALGLMMGAYMGSVRDSGLTMLVAQTIAGVIVLFCVGLFLGCLFNRAIESFIGGSTGFLCGFLVTPFSGVSEMVPYASVSLIMGGLIGATCWPLISIVRQLLTKFYKLALAAD